MAQSMAATGGFPLGKKPILSGSKILQMNLGFLGLQFSFGLQQANMTPIWAYLGADEANFPWLGIAGPLTGLIVQPHHRRDVRPHAFEMGAAHALLLDRCDHVHGGAVFHAAVAKHLDGVFHSVHSRRRQ